MMILPASATEEAEGILSSVDYSTATQEEIENAVIITVSYDSLGDISDQAKSFISSSRVRFISTFFEGAPLHPVAYWGQVVAGLRQRFRTAGWMSSFPDPELSCSLSPLACRVSAVWLALPFPAPTSSYS